MNNSDAAILRLIQADSSQSIAQLAAAVGLSNSACQRRIKALEEAGIIEGYAARLSARELGLGLHAFVEISLVGQSKDVLERFEAAARSFDDILECHLMAGSSDYLLRVAARDLDHFDAIHRNCLSRLPGVASMRSNFSIRAIKHWAGYPVRGH